MTINMSINEETMVFNVIILIWMKINNGYQYNGGSVVIGVVMAMKSVSMAA